MLRILSARVSLVTKATSAGLIVLLIRVVERLRTSTAAV
jgi:hypothetical protein